MEEYLQTIKKCPLFFDISDDELIRMLRCLGAKVEHFDKKQTIFPEGSPAKYIGILVSGKAHTVQLDYYGNRSILSEISAPQEFAEAFACAEVSSLPVSIVADEACEVMLVECAHILHTCQNNCSFHRSLIFNLMKDLADKTITFHQRIEVTSKRTTREKLLTYLTIQSKKVSSRSFDIPFDRQELADYLEVERSGLSAEISKLRKEGILKSEKNHFVLL